jgi:hypothetical protein
MNLPHRFTSASKRAAQKSFDCNLFVISKIFATKVEQLYTTNTSHRKQENFFVNISFIESFRPLKKTNKQKSHNRTMLFGNTVLKYDRHFDY